MVVVTGGAWQGKLDFVCRRFGIQPAQIFYCTGQDSGLCSDAAVLSGLHLFFRGQVSRRESCAAWAQNALPQLAQKIVLCDEIGCGVVPTDAVQRAWREETGRAMAVLCAQAQEVYRVFCGLELKLK